MDATQLSRWTRFAAKGGIGKGTAVHDCVAERPEDLMFLKGDAITVLMQLDEHKDVYLGYCEGVVGRFDGASVRFHNKLKTPVRTKRSSSTRPPSSAQAQSPPSAGTASPVPPRPFSRSSESPRGLGASPAPTASHRLSAMSSLCSLVPNSDGGDVSMVATETETEPSTSCGRDMPTTDSTTGLEVESPKSAARHEASADADTAQVEEAVKTATEDSFYSAAPSLTYSSASSMYDLISPRTPADFTVLPEAKSNPQVVARANSSDFSTRAPEEYQANTTPKTDSHPPAHPYRDDTEDATRNSGALYTLSQDHTTGSTVPPAFSATEDRDTTYDQSGSTRLSTAMSVSDGVTGIGLSLLQDFISGGGDDDDSDTSRSSTGTPIRHVRTRSSFDSTVEGFPIPPSGPMPAVAPAAGRASPQSAAVSENEYGEDWEGASDIYDNYRYSRASLASKMSRMSKLSTFATSSHAPPPIPSDFARPSLDRQWSSRPSLERAAPSSDAVSVRSASSRYSEPSSSPLSPASPLPTTTTTQPLNVQKSRLDPVNVTSPLLHTTFGSPEPSPSGSVNPDSALSPVATSPSSAAASTLRQRFEVEREGALSVSIPAASSAQAAPPLQSSRAIVIDDEDSDSDSGDEARSLEAAMDRLEVTLNKTKALKLDSPLIVVNPAPPPPYTPASAAATTGHASGSTPVSPMQAEFSPMPTPVLAPVPATPPGSATRTSFDTTPVPAARPRPSPVPAVRPRPPPANDNGHDPQTRQSLFGSARTSMFLPHPNAPKPPPTESSAGPMYGRKPIAPVHQMPPTAVHAMRAAMGGRVGPNGVRKPGTIYGVTEGELGESLTPVLIRFVLDPPNDVPANRMKRMASFQMEGGEAEAGRQSEGQAQAGRQSSVQAAQAGGAIPRANFFPRAGTARPRSRSFSAFESPFSAVPRPTKRESSGEAPALTSSRSMEFERQAVEDATKNPRLFSARRQYTPSPLAMGQTAVVSSAPSSPLLPPPSPHATSPPHRASPLGSMPITALSRNLPPLTINPEAVPPPSQSMSPTKASPVSRSSGEGASGGSATDVKPTSPPRASRFSRKGTNDSLGSPTSPRRRRESSRRRPSVETLASQHSDAPPPNSAGSSSLVRNTSLRSKLSFSALRSPKNTTQEEDGQQQTVQVQDMDFELVRPSLPTAQLRASEDSPITGRGSLNADRANLLRADSPATSQSSSIPRSPASLSEHLPLRGTIGSAEDIEAHRQRELKWVSLMSSTPASQARKSKKVRKLLQEGVPASVRYQVWAHLTDSKSKRLDGLYARLCQRGRVAASAEIERDVRECFAGDPRLADPNSLVCLLQAYLTMVPDIQYDKGLTYIAGQLLLQSPEEDAFWIFISLMDTHLRPYFAANAMQMDVDASLFAKAVEAADPSVARRLFTDLSIAPVRIVRPWFSSLFVEALPAQYFQRVWDIFLSEGVAFLFRVGLALITCCRRTLLDVTGEAPALALLRRPPLHLLSSTPDVLVELANAVKLKDDDVRKQRVKLEAQMKRQTQGRALLGAFGNGGGAGAQAISLPRA